jgi:hypothetical protein
MRRGRIHLGVVSAGAAFFISPSALAATPAEICRDLADGKLDGTYSASDFDNFLKNAAAQGYCNPIVVALPPSQPEQQPPVVQPEQQPPVVQPEQQPPAAQPEREREAGVAGAQKEKVAPSVAGAERERVAARSRELAPARRGALPFTGTELSVFAIVGALLLVSGALLRLSARQNRKSR